MNRLLILLVGICCTLGVMAQGSVKGRVMDKQTDEALQYVNVRVMQGAKLVKGAITDVNGSFLIDNLSDGTYSLQITFVGYKNLNRAFTISNTNHKVSFPLLYLSDNTHTLKEVQVTGQRSQMKLEVDRKTFSVDQVLAAAGGTASDLLENIPSVEVTTDGEISLRGNTSVQVWINGKASGLTTDNRAEILQQIPAESIDKIEVIDNPGAKYSPEGSAGIINIILKRDRRAGYYGSLQTGVNNNGGWNLGGNLNFSSKPFDAYVNLGYRKRKGTGGSESQTTYPLTQQYQNYDGSNTRGGHNLFARAGITFHITDKDDFTLSGMTMLGKHDDTSDNLYHYGTVGAIYDAQQMLRHTTGNGNMNMYHGELDYTHTWATEHKLDFNLSFDKWKSDEKNYDQDSYMAISSVDGMPTVTTYSYRYRPMFINNRSWEAKLDYVNKFSDAFKLEAGYDGTFSHENTPQESWLDASHWQATDGNYAEDKAYYNHFIYDINIHALYATINTKFGKWGFMAGLRGEYWHVNTESYTWSQEYAGAQKDDPFKKDYFQLFPSLFINYALTSSSQLQLNYTRRLQRPWGGQLNSFKDTRDASMISFGNPELTPEYTNSFQLNYLKTWPEHTLSVGVYYRPSTDVIQNVRYNLNDTIYSTSENVAKSQSAGIEIIGKDKLWRILDLTTTLNGYDYKLDNFSYVINNQTVTGASDENFSWSARVLASLILPYDISIQATGNYTSRQVITQGYRKPDASLDLGFRKTFFNKALAVSMNWRDVFGTRKWDNYTSSDSFTRHQKMWRDPRFNFTVSWNFGNMKSKKPTRNNTENGGGGDDEGGSFGGYGQ